MGAMNRNKAVHLPTRAAYPGVLTPRPGFAGRAGAGQLFLSCFTF